MSTVLDLADLAAEQWGLVTTAQARTLGVSAQAVARLTNQGALERMSHGVYRVTGAPPEPFDGLRVAWMGLDPGRRVAERLRDSSPEVVSHRSAAQLHELGDLEADEFEFIVPDRKQSRRDDVRFHRGKVVAGEWTVVDGLPVTTVVRTVADLAAARIDGGHLASVVRDALTVKQVDDAQLVSALRPYAHFYGVSIGDGEALLARFLQESGVSVPLGRAVELSSGGRIRPFDAAALPGSPGLERIHEQLASIQESIAAARSPALARISGQVASSARAGLSSEITGISAQLSSVAANALSSPELERLQTQLASIQQSIAAANSPAHARISEQVRQIVSKPEFRRLLDEIAKATRWQR